MSAPLQEGISSVLRRSSSLQNFGVFSNLRFAKIKNCCIFCIVFLRGMSSYEIIKYFAKRLFYHDVFVALQPLKEMSNVLRKSTSSLFFVPLSTVLDRWVEKSVLDRSPVTGLRGKLLQRDGSVFCNCEHCGCIVA